MVLKPPFGRYLSRCQLVGAYTFPHNRSQEIPKGHGVQGVLNGEKKKEKPINSYRIS